MVFKKGVRVNLITLRERKSRYIIAIKNQNREATGTALALINTISKIKNNVKSITFDQGSEFRKFDWIKDCLNTAIYFCERASPHQKGGIENGNGLIRIELPRTFNIEAMKQKEVNNIINGINNRPMKCLSYQTPIEFYLKYRKMESS